MRYVLSLSILDIQPFPVYTIENDLFNAFYSFLLLFNAAMQNVGLDQHASMIIDDRFTLVCLKKKQLSFNPFRAESHHTPPESVNKLCCVTSKEKEKNESQTTFE